MDVLGDLIERAQARGATFAHTRASGRWGIAFPASPGLGVHVLLEGDATVVDADGRTHPMTAGSVALVRADAPHRLASSADAPAEPLPSIVARHAPSVLHVVLGGQEPSARFVCGVYHYSGDLLTSLVGLLPPVVVAQPEPGSGLRAALDLLAAEMLVDAPGQQTVLDRLLDVAVVGLLRARLAVAGDSAPGWFRAREDPAVAAALAAVHTEPSRAWTVVGLARVAGVSRAAFARRFHAHVGVPPLEYVTGWRMALARERLRETADPLAAVAREVGYGSEFAFAAAFKREHGVPPGRWRRAERATSPTVS